MTSHSDFEIKGPLARLTAMASGAGQVVVGPGWVYGRHQLVNFLAWEESCEGMEDAVQLIFPRKVAIPGCGFFVEVKDGRVISRSDEGRVNTPCGMVGASTGVPAEAKEHGPLGAKKPLEIRMPVSSSLYPGGSWEGAGVFADKEGVVYGTESLYSDRSYDLAGLEGSRMVPACVADLVPGGVLLELGPARSAYWGGPGGTVEAVCWWDSSVSLKCFGRGHAKELAEEERGPMITISDVEQFRGTLSKLDQKRVVRVMSDGAFSAATGALGGAAVYGRFDGFDAESEISFIPRTLAPVLRWIAEDEGEQCLHLIKGGHSMVWEREERMAVIPLVHHGI